MNGNWTAKLKSLIDRNNKYTQLLIHNHFNRKVACTVYWQCYLPMVLYPLPATTMPPDQIQKVTKQVTTAFLLKMGYPRTFPQAVMYAPVTSGGIGFRHLGIKQGVQKVTQIIKQICANITTGTMLLVLIEQYQLNAGLGQPVLEDTRPIVWSEASWTNHLWAFLHDIQGQIILYQQWIPVKWTNNKFIMEEILKLNLKPKQLVKINNVQIATRTITLSDIMEHNGEYLCTDLLTRPPELPNTKAYYNSNQSTLIWPQYAPPSNKSWNLWTWTQRQAFTEPKGSRNHSENGQPNTTMNTNGNGESALQHSNSITTNKRNGLCINHKQSIEPIWFTCTEPTQPMGIQYQQPQQHHASNRTK